MKIYEIGTGYTPIPAQMGAATEIVVEELTKSFIKKGIDVTIIDIKTANRAKTNLPIIEVGVPKQFTSTDVQLGIMHKLKRVVYSVSLASVLKKILRTTKEKVVFHFHNQYNMYFFLKLVPEKFRKKCFLAYTNHSYIWHGEWEEIKDTVQKRYFQEIYSMKHADCVYVLNDTTKKTLIKELGIPENKISMIDNGVNTDIYTPLTQSEKNSIKKKMKIEGKKIFVQIGSVCDRKNQLGALELLTPLFHQNRECLYMYAGGIIDSEYQDRIKNYAIEQGILEQVKYLGELKPGKGLNECYSVADAMIFPSKSEGFSLVIIEAMSAGTPVFVHNSLQFKLADKCCRYSNEKEFMEMLEKDILCEEKLKQLSANARQDVLENYSWDKIAQDYYKTWC